MSVSATLTNTDPLCFNICPFDAELTVTSLKSFIPAPVATPPISTEARPLNWPAIKNLAWAALFNAVALPAITIAPKYIACCAVLVASSKSSKL